MIKKIFSGILIFVLLFNLCISAFAVEMNSANIVKVGSADYHLKYYREDRGEPTYVICSIVGYHNNGIFYPAYCMNKDLPGAESGEYTVNISDIINNPAVWRVVTNGYPYVTANEMGLENDFDAYTVTKMAIYCVLGQSNLEYFSYDENDIVGHRMYDVLVNLVGIGINGTLTPQSGVLNYSKVGELNEYQNYYYQEYSVSSRIDMDSYNINGIYNFPTGSYIGNTQNNAQNVFYTGENFKIFIPKSEFNKDINGRINISANVKSYPVFYGEAPEGKQNYVVTYDVFGNETLDINLNLQNNTGRLKVHKVDKDTKLPISGVRFKLVSMENENTYEAVTNENGDIIFDKLYQGKYNLIEIETSNVYIPESLPFEVNIQYNKDSQIVIDNAIKKGKAKVIKKDLDTNESMSGVIFEVINADTKEVIEEIITDENGEAYTSDLRVDNQYVLKEKWQHEEYKINENEYYFKVNADEIVEINVDNEKIKGSLKIIKVDEEDINICLEGVQFELYDENMNLLETLITNENGEANSLEYPSVNKIYYLKEVKTLEEYNLNNELIPINLIDNERLEIILTNEKIKGKVNIIKVDGENEDIKLDGVVFELYDENMKLLEKLVTDENGEVCSEAYPSVNKIYYIKEVKTKDGYILNDEIIKIILNDNGVLQMRFDNTKTMDKEVIVLPKVETEKVILGFTERTERVEKIEEINNEIVKKKLPKTGD